MQPLQLSQPRQVRSMPSLTEEPLSALALFVRRRLRCDHVLLVLGAPQPLMPHSAAGGRADRAVLVPPASDELCKVRVPIDTGHCPYSFADKGDYAGHPA